VRADRSGRRRANNGIAFRNRSAAAGRPIYKNCGAVGRDDLVRCDKQRRE
jgi:hypothetical protein